MDDSRPPEPLAALDLLLERLANLVQAREAVDSDAALRGYVEDAIDAAMAASGRAHDNHLGEPAVGQIEEAVEIARALLAELRGSSRHTTAIMDRSVELRRRAIRLTATALTLRRRSERRREGETLPNWKRETGGEPAGALHGVRVLLVGDRAAHEEEFTMLLATLAAEVCSARSLTAAVDVAHTFSPDVLVCDVPFPAAEGLICELRRRGVIAPALAAAAADDSGARVSARAAGFTGLIMRPVSVSALAQAVRAALGA
jgi:CheY-like chemotaxis protein